MMKHNHIRYSALSCGLFLIFSCTAVELHESGSLDTIAEVTFSVKWPEMQTDRPKDFSVALARHVNTVHYVYEWTEGEDGRKAVKCGDYYLTAFNVNNTLYSSNGTMEEFISAPGFSMRDISLSLKEMGADYATGLYGREWIDANPDFPFVTDAGHLYIESFPANLPAGQNTGIILEPEDITQELTFTFSVEVEDGAELTSVKADISGVPVTLYPMTETVSHEDLGRTSVSDIREIARNGNRITFEGQARVLGLFNSDDSFQETGAGIFHVHISSVIPSGTKTQDESVNIRDAIKAAKLMKVSGNGAGYCKNTDSAELKVPMIFKVTDKPISE